MTKIQFSEVNRDIESSAFDCGEPDINEYIRNSYYPLLLQHAYTYEIKADGMILGYYQILFRRIELDEFGDEISEHNPGFKESMISAVHIRYIAIDHRYQNKGIGTEIIKVIIRNVEGFVESWPIRVITIDAKDKLVGWYKKLGFVEMTKNPDEQDGYTTAMYFDCLKNMAELTEYEKNCE